MLRRIASFVVLLLIGFAAHAQTFKVKIADEPRDDIYDLVFTTESANSYRIRMVGEVVIFEGVFHLLSEEKQSDGSVVKVLKMNNRLTFRSSRTSHSYPDYTNLIVKAYRRNGVSNIHFNFTFVYEYATHIQANDLNLICKY